MRKHKTRKSFFEKQRVVFLLICIVGTILIYSLSSVSERPCFARSISNGYTQRGIASWYGKRFHGRRTASGERYDMFELTAAHCRLPLGSIVKVTNLSNNKEVIVRINDRGPFIRGRIIDLSLAAAAELRMVKKGITKVRIEVLARDI